MILFKEKSLRTQVLSLLLCCLPKFCLRFYKDLKSYANPESQNTQEKEKRKKLSRV